MPELPEVEIIVRGLADIRARRVESVWGSGKRLRLARRVDLRAVTAAARGRRVVSVRRRGKYVLLDFDGPAGVLVHLGMSGRLRVHGAGEPRAPHTHLVLALDDGRELRLVDPRRFGWVRAGAPVDALPELRDLGPDPLTDLSVEALAAALATSRAPVKAFLLDQKRLAGLGNIYACEALFHAGIHPGAESRRVRRRAAALLAGIRRALEGGIANRGTSLRDYVDALGSAGENFEALAVYGKEGRPCRRCGAPIRRRVDQDRSTFYCARCQKR